jgi:hypothetical protein
MSNKVEEALANLKRQADAMTAHGTNMQRYDIEVSVPLLHSADVMHKCHALLVDALGVSAEPNQEGRSHTDGTEG